MKKNTVLAVVGIPTMFVGLVATIVMLFSKQIIGKEVAILMCMALLGLYVGVGILIAVYRLVIKLD